MLQHLTGSADAAGELEWLVSVDRTIARAHQHAAGARREVAVSDRSTQGAPSNYRNPPHEPE